MTEPIPDDYYLKPIEPDNQEKTKVMSNEEYKPDANFVALMDKALIEKLTKQLAKERELRKELVDILTRIKPLAEDGHAMHKRNGCHQEFLSEDIERLQIVESLIQKAKDYEAKNKSRQ